MKLLKIFRFAAMAAVLPATGVAVAAVSMTNQSDQSSPSDTTAQVETLPAAVVTDGRQDSSAYSHVVRLTQDGELLGTLSAVDASGAEVPAAEVAVRISQQGRIVARTRTDANGRFVAKGIAPGVYSVFAQNDTAIAAFGVYAVSGDVRTAAVESIDALVVAGPDLAEVARVRRMYLPNVALNDLEATNEMAFAKAMRQSYRVTRQQGSIDLQQVATENASKSPSSTLQRQAVSAPGGVLEGKLSQIFGAAIDFRAIHCFLIQNGAVQSEVPCDADGSFSISGVEAGTYSFVAAGSGGFASFGLEVVTEGTASNILADGTSFVASTTVAPAISAALVAQEDTEEIEGEEQEEEEQEETPIFEAGAPGGSMGGGGGGGTGGLEGFGTVLGVAGGIAIGSALGNDDDNPQLASPFVPGS